ncbi:MAG: prolyl oligopeptidase family serine peptidase [Flavobacteriales bacterium]|nr:prolyl oligopeptidase family serine peptidase [Flavobacteriales bacterium]
MYTSKYILTGVIIATMQQLTLAQNATKVKYPTTAKNPVELDFHGTTVTDNYQWLEDDNSEQTVAWVKAQNEVTEAYLSAIPFRTKIKDRITELFNFEKVGSPYRVGDYYFLWKNSGLEPQGKYYVRKGIEGPDELFLDVNALSVDGTVSASLGSASDDNKYIAINQAEAGSDWSQIRVMNIATKKETGDVLKWVKFSGAAWYKDGFYYSRYPEPKAGDELSASNQFHMVYYHKLGTPQSEDKLIYTDKNRPHVYHNVGLTEDKKYLFLYAAPGTDGFEVWYKSPEDSGPFKPLFTDVKYHTSVVDSKDSKLIVHTDVNAPKYRLVVVDPLHPSPENWVELVPQSDDLLEGAGTGGGKLFLSYLSKANTRIFSMNYDGTDKKEIALPDKTGSAGGFSGKRDHKQLFYAFTSFTYPGAIYTYDIASHTSKLFYQPKLKFNPADYESKQVMYKSKDGTTVPMFIVHKRGLKMDGSNPTLLYSYGGFNISLTPSFSTSRIVLLENGAVFAMPNLRGGGEFGEDWHKGGMLDKKQNVFDDFIAAAEYLIKEGYTSKDKLAIEGGSNGGLLVGACMTQRPDLFKVCFPAVGVMDMLRYHQFTVGKGWIPEYGCADSSKTEFNYLRAYSPYHNMKPAVNYPATMVLTADHDDRVVPAHSFKFAARLQECQTGTNPTLIRIETRAGHGAGKSTEQVIQEQSDKWAFFFFNLGVKL